MKKYIKAARRTLQFPENGSGSPADARAGKVNFGKGKEIRLPNDGVFSPITAKTYFDSVKGEVVTSVNIAVELELDEPYVFDGKGHDYEITRLYHEFMSCTPEECSQIYKAVYNMTTEELYDFLAAYEEKDVADSRKRNLTYAKGELATEDGDTPYSQSYHDYLQEYVDKYEGKIDDEGYWLE